MDVGLDHAVDVGLDPITLREGDLLYFCFYPHPAQTKKGKLVVVGSTHMFSDQYLDKEENAKILVSSSCTQHVSSSLWFKGREHS